jgi:hypothetical protein
MICTMIAMSIIQEHILSSEVINILYLIDTYIKSVIIKASLQLLIKKIDNYKIRPS